MNLQAKIRAIHHWGALVVALPLGVTCVAGLLLMVKKDVAWIQPPTHIGSAPHIVPPVSVPELFAAAASVPEAHIDGWGDVARMDLQPGKGIVKFVSTSRVEVQIDTATVKVLSVARRRSDLIESLHDGSFFASWTKHYLFLPSAVVLFVLWLTGLYMFFTTRIVRWRKSNR